MKTPGAPTTNGTDMVAKLPALVQHDIIIRCPGDKQGSVYSARVLSVEDRCLRINLPRRVAGQGYLRSSRPVVMVFVIGEQLYKCKAEYRAEQERTRELVIDGEIKQTTRRSHSRSPISVHAAFVPISDFSLAQGQFANMRWKKSMTLDLSAGGVLLQVPFQAPTNSYLLINLEIPAFHGPFFVFGQVRWVGLSDARHKLYMCGVRFILREELSSHFSERAISELPKIMIPFDKNMQKELDAYIHAHPGQIDQGDDDDQ